MLLPWGHIALTLLSYSVFLQMFSFVCVITHIKLNTNLFEKVYFTPRDLFDPDIIVASQDKSLGDKLGHIKTL